MEPQASSPTAAPAASPLSVPNPERPRKPAQPDLRTGTDEAKAARQQAYAAAMAKYSLAKAEYDDLLYPAYRAAQKKAARPADDGAQAVQRRRDNPAAAANHVCVCRAATGLRPLLTTTLTTELPMDRCCVGPIQEDRLSAGQAVVNVPLSGWGVYPALSWDGEAGGRAGGDPPSPKGG